MAANVPEVVLDLYEGVPIECFVAGVPFELIGFNDDEIVPFSFTLTVQDGPPAKWIRFCGFLPFLDACRTYWMEAFQYPLYVCVMPYSPLRDAHHLHELIQDPDDLSNAHSLNLGEDIGEAATLHKSGLADVADGIKLKFTVVNYEMLRTKARDYCTLSHVSNALLNCQMELDMCRNVIGSIPRSFTPGQLTVAIDDSRRHFVLALLEGYAENTVEDMDLHSAMLNIYPEIHDRAYEDICHHCYPDQYEFDYEDTPATRAELDKALQMLRSKENDFDHVLSIREAAFSLMSAEGAMEFDKYNVDSRGMFLDSRDMIIAAMKPTLDYVREATTSHSLMGV